MACNTVLWITHTNLSLLLYVKMDQTCKSGRKDNNSYTVLVRNLLLDKEGEWKIILKCSFWKYRVFSKTHNTYDVWYIYNFPQYRWIWYMNEGSLSWRFCVHVVFMQTYIQYDMLWPNGHAVKEPYDCQLHHITCHLWSLLQHLHFPLVSQQCAGWCGTHDLWDSPKRNNYWDSCPVNMVNNTIHNQSALEIDLTRHNYQRHHTEHQRHCVDFQKLKSSESHFVLVHEPIEVEMNFITKLLAKVAEYCHKSCKKSWQNLCLQCLKAVVSICTAWTS